MEHRNEVIVMANKLQLGRDLGAEAEYDVIIEEME